MAHADMHGDLSDSFESISLAPVEREDLSPIDTPDNSFYSPNMSASGSDTSSINPHRIRPQTLRRCTDPRSSSELLQQTASTTSRPTSSGRNRSPFSRSHLRSRSSGSALSAPSNGRIPLNQTLHTSSYMSRGSDSPGLFPASPLRSPARQHSPYRQEEGIRPRSPRWPEITSPSSAIESIQEDSELDFTTRPSWSYLQSGSTLAPAGASALRSTTLPRRRPHSPLHTPNAAGNNTTTGFAGTTLTSSSGSLAGSPLFSATIPENPSVWQKHYNEAYPPPLLHHSASSSSFGTSISMPSTPTSMRSRSPSISSLETIEDAPDLECAAVEGFRLEKLRLAAEREERGEDEDEHNTGRGHSTGSRRGSFENSRASTFAIRGALSRERKRWSVCGGERRADLDLETIYED